MKIDRLNVATKTVSGNRKLWQMELEQAVVRDALF